MTVIEFYNFLCEKLPSELSLKGDCDGLSCCPDPDREVQKVLIALDATDSIIDEAIEEECEVILTHHPMLFGGIDKIVAGEYRSNKLIKLIRNGISVMSFHTRLDVAPGGVNDMLAQLLGLSEITRFGENGIARLGKLESPMTAYELAQHVKDNCCAPFVEYSDSGKLISTVGVCGGSAKSVMSDAAQAGADALIGGEFGFHAMTDSPDMGISLIAAGHFFTENPVCARLFELTAEADIIPIISFSNRTGTL